MTVNNSRKTKTQEVHRDHLNFQIFSDKAKITYIIKTDCSENRT